VPSDALSRAWGVQLFVWGDRTFVAGDERTYLVNRLYQGVFRVG
jgi:hypothetical protein